MSCLSPISLERNEEQCCIYIVYSLCFTSLLYEKAVMSQRWVNSNEKKNVPGVKKKHVASFLCAAKY